MCDYWKNIAVKSIIRNKLVTLHGNSVRTGTEYGTGTIGSN